MKTITVNDPKRVKCQKTEGIVRHAGRSAERLSLMISIRTLNGAAAQKLFTQAVEDAHGKILAAEAKVEAAGRDHFLVTRLGRSSHEDSGCGTGMREVPDDGEERGQCLC